jgi:hypothetical protein
LLILLKGHEIDAQDGIKSNGCCNWYWIWAGY